MSDHPLAGDAGAPAAPGAATPAGAPTSAGVAAHAGADTFPGAAATAPPPAAGPVLPARRLWPLVVRSFLLQASWSYERMQTVGFAFLLAGEGRKLAPGDAAAPFLQRHLGFFNTNPPMASFIAGAAVRMEEEVAAGRLAPAEIERFKRAVVSPLAAWGDTLFWATLRPTATAIGAVIGWLAGAWGALAYLIVYNALHLTTRASGLQQGYRLGRGVAGWISSSSLRRWPGRLQPVGLAALGMAAGLSLAGGRAQFGDVGAALLGLVMVGAFLGFRRTARLGDAWGLVPIAIGFAYLLLARGR